MLAHSKEFSPRLSELLGDDQLRIFLRATMNRAAGHGFTNRGPVRLSIELSFLFGSAFDNDPQYPWAAKILQAADDQMLRAELLYEETVKYLEHVSGPGNRNTRKALVELSIIAQEQIPIPPFPQFTPALIGEMVRIFPEKANYIGKEGLRALITSAISKAQAYGIVSGRGQALIVILMFAFGHGCVEDDLYPWISRTLTDRLIVDGAKRAERLENKALTWLSHVLARRSEGKLQ